MGLESETKSANNADGLEMKGTFLKLSNVSVSGFGRHGIHLISDADYMVDFAVLEGVRAFDNGGSGFYAETSGPSNANAMTFIACDAIDNAGYGFFDDGWNNVYLNPRAAHNTKGDYYARSLGGVIVSPYAEKDSTNTLVMDDNKASDWKVIETPTGPVCSGAVNERNNIVL